MKNIDLGQQLLSKTFFDKFNFKNNLFPKLGRKIVNFLNLSTLSEKLQKKFQCNFCDSTSITFIVISFHEISLTWWNAYICIPILVLYYIYQKDYHFLNFDLFNLLWSGTIGLSPISKENKVARYFLTYEIPETNSESTYPDFFFSKISF